MESVDKTVAALLRVQRQRVTWECKRGEQGRYESVLYNHEGHGIIDPIYSERMKRYRCGMCPCEKKAQEAYRLQQEQKACMLRRDDLKRTTFGWLGREWTDPGLDTKTFANYKRERQQEAFENVQSFLDIMRGTLILYGSFGTGKTHLLAALCNALHERDRACLFASSTKLFSAIGDRIQRNESYISILSRAMHTPLLVLDDLDKTKRSDFREEAYFSIIDERVKRELPTAISTNRLAELESLVGGAVVDRLSIGQIAIEMIGPSYRPEL